MVRLSPSVRTAQPRDAERLAEIYTQAIESGRSTMDTEPSSASDFSSLMARLREDESLLVVESAHGVAGWGIVKRYSDRPGYAWACETSVYVAEDAQAHGYGSLLLGAVVERARELGYRHLVAKILAVNEQSVRFHQKFGYEIVGRQRDIGFIRGRSHDIVIMQKLFPRPTKAGPP